MADEFHSGTNWWDSTRNRYDSGGNTGGGSSSSSSGLNSLGGSFSWPADLVDANKGRSSMESGSVSDSSGVFHDTHQKQLQQQGHDSSGADLHMMGLGLSSPAMDWNQALLRGEKSDGGFRSMLQENLNSSANYQQETGIGSSHHHQVQWRGRMFSSGGDSSIHEFKQMSRGFSLDQTQFSPHGSSSTDSTVTCQGLQSSFQMDSSAIYGAPSSAIFPGLLGSENQPHQSSFESRSSSSICYPYATAAAAGANYGITSNELMSPWSKVPPFLRNSPPKQNPHSQLHFSNNAPFWNASASAMTDVRPPSFFPSSLQPQFPTTSFEEKPKKNISEVGDSSTVTKKGGSETAAASKRPRNEAASTLPAAFKVRKEKMGDRITALQQLVSPFGKTDTASVLSEAIEYIKFLHEQVTLLSTPYLKNGAPTMHQQQQPQSSDKSKDPEGQKQDLRSRGLCLVPVSSTLPVTHETPVDIWTPTFGGTFR